MSNDLPRAKVASFLWRSRAVTSSAQVTPSTPAAASASLARLRRRPMTAAISPSNSTRSLSGGSTIGAPGPITEEIALRKTSGSGGIGLPSSAAWAW